MSAPLKTAPSAINQPAEIGLLDQIVERMERSIERRMQPAVQPMELRGFDELERWAERAARSTMVPKDYQGKPDNIILAVQLGSELGLRPMQSLQNIAVINGRPSIWGDAMLALCKTHPAYVSIQENITGVGDKMEARCVVIRRGEPPFDQTFSVDDAKTAKLWQKKGYNGQDTPWITSPKRMLQMRARGFALRDAFPDKLKGLLSAEEASDYTLEAAGITPQRETLSAAPPAAAKTATPKTRTRGDFLNDLEAELGRAKTQDDWERINVREDVQKAIDVFQNEHKDRLSAMLDAAYLRVMGEGGKSEPPPAGEADYAEMVAEVNACADAAAVQTLTNSAEWLPRVDDLFPPDADLLREAVAERVAILSQGARK